MKRLLLALRRTYFPKWYYSFLSDPIVYLKGKGVKEIVIIGGTEGSNDSFSGITGMPENINFDELEINFDKMPDDEDLKKEIKKHDSKWLSDESKEYLKVKKHNGYLLIGNIWLLRFFNYKISENKRLEKFKQYLKDKKLIHEDTHRIIINPDLRKKAKECYFELFGKDNNKFNNTSLVMYHGPLRKCRKCCTCINDGASSCRISLPYGLEGYLSLIKAKNIYKTKVKEPHYNESEVQRFCDYLERLNDAKLHFSTFSNNIYGHFLTGDINLKYKCGEIEKWDEIETHFGHWFEKMSVIQVPHHGSDNNWNDELLSKVNKSGNPSLYVASAKITGKKQTNKKHPNSKVVDKIFENNCFLWCNEFNSVTITGEIN